MADGKTTSNMFIFCLEGEWRQEVAGLMGNVVINLKVHLFRLFWHELVSEGFRERKKQIEEKGSINWQSSVVNLVG